MIKDIRDFPGNDTEQLRAAAEWLRSNPGSTLKLESRTYILRDEAAAQLQQKVMNGEYGANCEEALFNRDFRYSVGLDLTGAENVTFDGNGATILSDGYMETLSLKNCRNVKVKNVNFDLKRKAFSRGKILAVKEEGMFVRFPEQTDISERMPADRMYIYSTGEERFTYCVGHGKIRQTDPETLFFSGTYDRDSVGNELYVWHCFHFRPMILIYESENTVLQDVKIFNNCGMGIVGHRSRDIFIRRLMVIPSPGYGMSTNTDATHFSSCRGKLRFENCIFEGQGDDATNVHTYYHTILEKTGDRCLITTLAPTGTHCQKPDHPEPGDIMELCTKATLTYLDKYTVTAVEPDENSRSALGDPWSWWITLDRPLPEDCDDKYLADVSAMPELEFTGCSVRNNIARGVLIKTRNALVEGCLFDCGTSSAVHIAAEAYWHEGVSAQNVTVRNNRIIRRGPLNRYGAMWDAGGICINVASDVPPCPVHKNIVIENNQIVCPDTPRAIYAADTDGLTIRNNEISSGKKGEEIFVTRCENVVEEGNRIC